MNIKMVSITFGLLVLSTYVALFLRNDAINQVQLDYAMFVIVLGALPGILSLVDRAEAGLMPLMPLHGLFYSLTFGLPALSSKTVWYVSDPDAITDALGLTIIGLVSLYLGYYAFRGLYSRSRPVRFLNAAHPNQQVGMAWALYGFYLLFQLVPGLRAIPSVGQISEPLGYISVGTLFLLALDNKLSKKQLVLLATVIGVTLIIKTVSGSLALPVFFLVFLSIVYWAKKRIIPWHFILISGVIVILLNPIKGKYREVAWQVNSSQSYPERALLFYTITSDYYSGSDIVSLITQDTNTVNRLAHIAVFSKVIELTPEHVPYWLGGSYETLWTSFIPRLLWPDKPQATIGQEFGHRYGFLHSSDKTTSFNCPWLPEFYANYGVLGVLAGMFAVGWFFRVLVQKFSAPTSRRLEYILGITITFTLFYAESNFALMAGGLLLTYLALLVLLRVMALVIPKGFSYQQRAQ